MTRRRTLIAAAAIAVVAVSFAAVWLTGVAPIGDPFSGTWQAPNADAGTLVIRHTDAGYSFTFVNGTVSSGWAPVERDGNTLTFAGQMLQPNGEPTGEALRIRFVFRPLTRNLVYYDRAAAGGSTLKRASDNTSAPPVQAQQTPSYSIPSDQPQDEIP